jgi:hypothetical protein
MGDEDEEGEVFGLSDQQCIVFVGHIIIVHATDLLSYIIIYILVFLLVCRILLSFVCGMSLW